MSDNINQEIEQSPDTKESQPLDTEESETVSESGSTLSSTIEKPLDTEEAKTEESEAVEIEELKTTEALNKTDSKDSTYIMRRGAIEAMLFVSDEPVTTVRLADMLGISLADTDEILCALAAEYSDNERGVQLREVAGGWRLYTHPLHHDIIEKYVLSWDTQKLSQAALEALAVIAYNQPTTRAVVSSIRGVNSDAVIASLVEKGLVREAGRDDSPGQPILYATTRTFLEKFGLRSVKDLAPLEDFAANEETRRLIVERLSSTAISDEVASKIDGYPDDDSAMDEDIDDNLEQSWEDSL